MSIIKFRVSWNQDDSTFRDIEILSGQTFDDLHQCIKRELLMPADMESIIYVSDENWNKGRQISSRVEKNLRDAIALSMKKTPIGALIVDPHQKFIYECEHPKAWLFYIDLITLMEETAVTHVYPRCIKGEGVSPSQFGILPIKKDSVVEIEERYDLANDEEGFGDEGEDDNNSSEEEDTSAEEFTNDDV
jgi:hypothetical protein